MLTLNLTSLGISEEQLTNAILNELGISREEAVKRLADKLGVKLPAESTVCDGARVQTDEGETVARLLTRGDADTLRRAGEILSRLQA